ncbi:MAG: hypothetical protein GY798_20050 [Hyphomicrobiales bacterium]|nr:hypothetical protein [Hyphomicrobiales bacterium]
MPKTTNGEQRGLAWPEHYADLEAGIEKQWGVDGLVYLIRKLSGGKSGALVYVADLNSRDFGGQAILKFDDYPDPQSQETNEAERHGRALKSAPEYARAHLSEIVNSYAHDQRLAILSTIAGRGLEYAEPWANSAYHDQLATAVRVAGEILEDWNKGYSLSDGLRTPADLLVGWLGYRLDPNKGRIHDFLREEHGLTPDQPTFMFDGEWFPNPLNFVASQASRDTQLRAVVGNVHGDLHGQNILVSSRSGSDPAYYLIDLALFEDNQCLFYDHAYFELTHLLRSRDQANAENWLSILASVGRLGQGGTVVQGDDLGLVQLVSAIRRELFQWVDRHEGNRLAHMESQALLARVAVGLCFAHRQISNESRSVAFLYAAYSLKDLLKHNGVDWPKYGPPVVVAAGGAGAVLVGQPSPHGQSEPAGAAEPVAAHVDAVEDTESGVPDKPAIAVMAFEDLSEDRTQEYFADGVSEDLVTELSRVDWLTVRSHESTLPYRGQRTDVRQVGRELGVQYVVSGSVRRAGDMVRVTGHLVDIETGNELWSERYDRKVDNIFAVQDEIAAAIVANIDSEAKTDQRELAARKRGPLNVWEMYQKSIWHFFRLTPDDDARALEQADRAVVAAPRFAGARAVLSALETRRLLMGYSTDWHKELDRAARNAERAVALDKTNATARVAMTVVLFLQGRLAESVAEGREAIRLNPSSAIAHVALGGALYWSGRSADALQVIERAMVFNPRDRLRFSVKGLQALCEADLGSLENAESFAREAIRVGPRAAFGHLALALCLVRAGRVDEAHEAIEALHRARADYGIKTIETTIGAMEAKQRDRFLSDLRTAGLAG